jgi:AbrB family looped-hinge helix DNA binding protein
MADTATLSSRFRITIPKAVREAQDWRPGRELAFLPCDGGMMLVPVPHLSELVGIGRGADPTDLRDREDRT